jgi:hypothetical protein
MSTKITGILSDKFINKSQRDVLFVVRELGRDSLQLYQVLVTYLIYILLHYVLLFPYGKYRWHYELTYEIPVKPVNKPVLNSAFFTGSVYTFVITSLLISFTLVSYFNNML